MRIFENIDCMEGMQKYKDVLLSRNTLAIVDPPYGINIDRRQEQLAGKKIGNNGGRYKQYHKTSWDESPPHVEYFNKLFGMGKNQIIWGGNYFHDVKLEGVIIWHKGVNGSFKEGELAKTSFNTFRVYSYSRADAYINGF